ncbi:universal stress protein [Singulisphaera sp. PoT]|uniref:universal stress protein n=1 Tax=Singulisphaera sp. PoT TaxID=3411797 RepID=UPI003BF58FB4
MLKSILLGLDGSEVSDSVEELGLQLARRFDALLVGMGVVDEPGLRLSEMRVFQSRRDWHGVDPMPLYLSGTSQHVKDILERFVLRCKEVGVSCKTLEGIGTPFVQILKEAQRFDLILLGQETHFEYEHETNPDVTIGKVLRDSPRPVMSVPKSPRGGEAIVLAYDGSLQASRALYAFEASGLGRSRKVHVLSVEEKRPLAEAHVDRAMEFLKHHEIEAVPHALESSIPPAEVILNKVDHYDAGLIVMGVYGQPIVREFVLGSVTGTVLKGSPVPVFCYQ